MWSSPAERCRAARSVTSPRKLLAAAPEGINEGERAHSGSAAVVTMASYLNKLKSKVTGGPGGPVADGGMPQGARPSRYAVAHARRLRGVNGADARLVQ
jgi:hypothetical protein